MIQQSFIRPLRILTTSSTDIPYSSKIKIMTACELKDFLLAINSFSPDLIFINVDAGVGFNGLCKDYTGIAIALDKPIAIIVQRSKKVLLEQYKAILNIVEQVIVKAIKKEHLPLYDLSIDFSLKKVSKRVIEGAMIPIIGLPGGEAKLQELISVLEVKNEVIGGQCEILIMRVQEFNENMIVLEGVVKTGEVHTKQYLRLGLLNNKFITVQVKKLVRDDEVVEVALSDQEITITVTLLSKESFKLEDFKENLIILERIDKNQLIHTFDSEVTVIKREFIKIGQALKVFIGNQCEVAEVIDLAGETILKEGDKGIVKCQLKELKYVKKGEKVFFVGDGVVAIGIISELYN